VLALLLLLLLLLPPRQRPRLPHTLPLLRH
jgi:hypothetical protein